MKHAWILRGASAAVVGLATVGAMSPALAAPEKDWRLPALPKVTPVPITPESRPFLAAAADLDAVGYVEEEYFLTGKAGVYEWDGPDGRIKLVAGPGTYTNRILVRRPKDPARFNGNVEINLLNATTLVDRGWPLDFERMVADGEVWIGITTKSLTASTLKSFDSRRYAPLNWSNPAPEARRCANPSIIPDYTRGGADRAGQPARLQDATQEDGLVWDMIGQLGLLLKSDRRDAVLPGFAKPKLFMIGISQSALMINTWVVAFHDRYRTADGAPVFDGYMPIVGANMLRIAQCSTDVLPDDPRNKAPVLDVPIIKIYSEAEMNYGRTTYRPDAISARSGTVTYEIAGAPHARGDIPGRPRKALGMPSEADVARALVGFPAMPRTTLPAGQAANDYPWAPALRAAFRNLEDWSNKGIAPPQTPRITLDAERKIVRDQDGNTEGGLRLPYIEVPTASYAGAIAQTGLASITGAKVPFDAGKLKSLYGDHATFVRKFSAATDAAVAARLIMPKDAANMKEAELDKSAAR